jgi:mRNA-degrading endonuclease RelE of RelBE toxin-antitoxin system
MSCSIIVIDDFKRDARKLVKKYPSLKHELAELQGQLMANPRMGVIIHENTYKIRLAVKSKGRGKSGGLRVITHVVEVEIRVEAGISESNTTIFMMAIYDKSEMGNISEKEIKGLLDEIKDEFDEEDSI